MCPDCYNAHEMLRASFEVYKVTPVKEFKAEDCEAALLKRQHSRENLCKTENIKSPYYVLAVWHARSETAPKVILYVMSYIRVRQFSLDGRFIGKTITDLPGPVGIETAPDGRILVTGYTVNKVYMLSVCFNQCPSICSDPVLECSLYEIMSI